MPHSENSEDGNAHLEHQENIEISQLKLKLKQLTAEKKNWVAYHIHMNEKELGSLKHDLEQEKENIVKNYRIADAYSQSKKVFQQGQRLETRLIERHHVNEQIQKEREIHVDLDKEIARAEHAIQQLRLQESDRKKTTKPTHQKLSHKKMQKKIWVLEEQVHREQANVGKILAENAAMREQISTLSQVRKKFNNHNKSFQNKMVNMRTKLNKMIEQANQAYDQTVETKNKIDIIEKKARKDSDAASIEYARLDRIIYHHEQQKQFMKTKLFNRNDLLIDKNIRELAGRQNQDIQRQKKLELLQTAWAQIIKYLGVKIAENDENLRDSIVEKFLARENENFDILVYISEQQRLNIKIADELEENKAEIIQFCNSTGPASKEKEMCIMKNTTENAEEQLQKLNSHFEFLDSKIEKAGKMIEMLFIALKCDESIIDIPMKVGNKYTSKKILRKYLAQIECKMYELFALKAVDSIHDTEAHIDDLDYLPIWEALGHCVHKIDIQKPVVLKPVIRDSSKSRLNTAKKQESDVSIDETIMTEILSLDQLREIVRAARQKKKERLESREHTPHKSHSVMRPMRLLI